MGDSKGQAKMLVNECSGHLSIQLKSINTFRENQLCTTYQDLIPKLKYMGGTTHKLLVCNISRIKQISKQKQSLMELQQRPD